MELTHDQLMGMDSVAIPKKLDGSGVVHLSMRKANLIALRLDEFPRPKDYGRPNPGGTGYRISPYLRNAGPNQGYFRVAYAWNPQSAKPHTASFRLSCEYTMETLQVITDHLNEKEVEWLYLTNRFGNPVSRSCFSSTTFA